MGCGSEYALGQLRTCYGLRFTLDGLQLIAVDHDGSRVSVYTTGGAFVKTLGAPELCNPSDVELCGDSCIAVADRGNHCVRILSMDTGECVRSFGAKGKESGEFSAPTALATHGGVLYVLDRDSGRVQAFR